VTIEDLRRHLITASSSLSEEYTRMFHGRGNTYGGYRFLSVDSADTVLFAILFDQTDEEKAILSVLREVFESAGRWKALILQRRYLPSSPSEILAGELPSETYAIENGLTYRIDFQNAQNIGFFPDMKNGRTFVREHAAGANVLNLFAYTCSFSVVAVAGGASSVTNVDMNKNVLSIGRENHRRNGLDTQHVEFMPYNILKSWSRIRKNGPYDLIIIDPPSFQKGSFAATADYAKIIRRLHEFAAEDCTVLSALNAPELESGFIQTLFAENAPEFQFIERLKNPETFPEIDEERSLKNLIFTR
jgi:23S rRNA (cytosine1962-C5)-methyltransferase